MGRLMAIDFGKVRTGIAVTDELQLIASGLTTVKTPELLDFIAEYITYESVEGFVIGLPKRLNNEPSEIETEILVLINNLEKRFPHMPIHRMDERFTSKLAQRAILESGASKKRRRDKGLIDQVSATLILQDFLAYRS